MKLERGFKRLTALVSICLALCAIVLIAMWRLDMPKDASPEIFGVLMVLLVAAVGIPWAIFYCIRWIVLGFKEESPKEK